MHIHNRYTWFPISARKLLCHIKFQFTVQSFPNTLSPFKLTLHENNFCKIVPLAWTNMMCPFFVSKCMIVSMFSVFGRWLACIVAPFRLWLEFHESYLQYDIRNYILKLINARMNIFSGWKWCVQVNSQFTAKRKLGVSAQPPRYRRWDCPSPPPIPPTKQFPFWFWVAFCISYLHY